MPGLRCIPGPARRRRRQWPSLRADRAHRTSSCRLARAKTPRVIWRDSNGAKYLGVNGGASGTRHAPGRCPECEPDPGAARCPVSTDAPHSPGRCTVSKALFWCDILYLSLSLRRRPEFGAVSCVRVTGRVLYDAYDVCLVGTARRLPVMCRPPLATCAAMLPRTAIHRPSVRPQRSEILR